MADDLCNKPLSQDIEAQFTHIVGKSLLANKVKLDIDQCHVQDQGQHRLVSEDGGAGIGEGSVTDLPNVSSPRRTSLRPAMPSIREEMTPPEEPAKDLNEQMARIRDAAHKTSLPVLPQSGAAVYLPHEAFQILQNGVFECLTFCSYFESEVRCLSERLETAENAMHKRMLELSGDVSQLSRLCTEWHAQFAQELTEMRKETQRVEEELKSIRSSPIIEAMPIESERDTRIAMERASECHRLCQNLISHNGDQTAETEVFRPTVHRDALCVKETDLPSRGNVMTIGPSAACVPASLTELSSAAKTRQPDLAGIAANEGIHTGIFQDVSV